MTRARSGPDVANKEMPTGSTGGAQAYVTGTLRSVSVPISASKLSTALLTLGSTTTNVITLSNLNNNKTNNSALSAVDLCCPSPTSSASSSLNTSPSSISPPPAYNSIYGSSSPRTPSLAGSTKSVFTNPLQTALVSPSKPVKPVLTPRSSHDGSAVKSNDVRSSGIDVLSTVFPASSPAQALPHHSVDLSDISPVWGGVVLENPSMGTRTLYVTGGSYADVNMRESVCGVLEKAEDELNCTGVVMVLEKNSSDLGELIHQLLYVGGTITTGPFTPNSAYLLVGMDV